MSLDLRGHTAGEIITADWGNYVDQTLLLDDIRLMELTLELALQGLAPDFVSMYYDLFSDTSMSDGGVLTANLDVANGTLHLPTSWTANTDYLYQTLEKTMDYSAAAAHMIVRHDGSAHGMITPKLSVIASGAHSFVTGTLIDSRSTVATLGVRTDTFDNLAYIDTTNTTATVSTSASLVRLPGGANDAWSTLERGTNNAVADILSDYLVGTDYNSRETGVSLAYHPTDGSVAITYASKEFNATYANIRVRVRNADGTYKSWAGQTYIDVTTSAAAHQTAPRCLWNQAGTALGIAYLAGVDAKFVLVNTGAGSVGTPFTIKAAGTGIARFDIDREVDSDYVWAIACAGGAITTFDLFRFAMTDAAPGSAVVSPTANADGSPLFVTLSLDQENDAHVAWMGSSNARIRYNIWDKSAAAWLYTPFNSSGDKLITKAYTIARKRDTRVIADKTQAGSNKKAWVVYTRDNATPKSAVYMRTIIAGTISAEFTIKTSASVSYHHIAAGQDANNSLLQVLYTEASAGLLSTPIDDSGNLGAEAVVDVAATDSGVTIAISPNLTQAIIAFREGAENNAASEMWLTTRNLGYTLVQKVYQSTVFTVPQQATKFLVSSTQSTPTNTTLSWQVSADNGAHWDAATPGVIGTFSHVGTQLIVKALLQTTNVNVTPSIDISSVKALLAATENTYEWTGLAGTKVKAQLLLKSDDVSHDTIIYDQGVILS